MSWYVAAGNVPYDLSHADILRLRDEAIRQNDTCGDQFDAALVAAVAIIQSGSVGSPSHTFSVAMSGHSNPGHGPREGFANDVVTVTVAQT